MFDFKELVDDVLLLEDINSVISNVNKYFVPQVDLNILTGIFNALASKSYDYIPSKYWNIDKDYVPLLDMLAQAYKTSPTDSVKGFKALKKAAVDSTDVNDFYNRLPLDYGKFNAFKAGTSYNFNDPSISSLYRELVNAENSDLIASTAYSSYTNETIINALEKIFDARLHVEEKRIITRSFAGIAAFFHAKPQMDGLFKSIFTKAKEYSLGSEKFDPKVADVLYKVQIDPNKLLTLALNTKLLFESLLIEVCEFDKLDNETIKKFVAEIHNTHPDCVYDFAKTGKIDRAKLGIPKPAPTSTTV